MSGIEHCASAEQMPPLEPLAEPSSETCSANDPSTAPPFPPHSRTPPLPSAPNEKCERDKGHLIRNVVAPLKLGLVLENKGNVARDHLASERTYLAYVRTSLACASAGVALVQLFTLSTTGSLSAQQTGVDLTKFAKPLGATIILFALVILLVGFARYFATQSALVRGHFPVARHSITGIAFVLGVLVGVVFAVLVAGSRR